MADEQSHPTVPIPQQPAGQSSDDVAQTPIVAESGALPPAPDAPAPGTNWHLPVMVAGITVGALLFTSLTFGAGFAAGRATADRGAAGRSGSAVERSLDGPGVRGKAPGPRGQARRGMRGQMEDRRRFDGQGGRGLHKFSRRRRATAVPA